MSDLEFRLLEPSLEESLARFFVDLGATEDTRHFHPHDLTAEEARRRVRYGGKDLYYVAVVAGRVDAYGLLRGWDEGYAIPSLGIALHSGARGTGLARAFMLFLHAAARGRGAEKVRLKVYPDNTRAVALYRGLGYSFESREGEQLVGIAQL